MNKDYEKLFEKLEQLNKDTEIARAELIHLTIRAVIYIVFLLVVLYITGR